MNIVVVRRLAMLCLVAALSSICLMAQGPIQVTVPFDFTIGSKSFPSGDYVVRSGMAHTVLAIQSVDGQSAAMTLTTPLYGRNESGGARLIFNRYGDRYFLSQVWANGSEGRELSRSTSEKELIAKTKSTKSVALVASSRE